MFYIGPKPPHALYKSPDFSKVRKVQQYYQLQFPEIQFPIHTYEPKAKRKNGIGR
jgi:hypothetical protein